MVSSNEDTSGVLRIYLGNGSGGFTLSPQGAISVGSNNICWVGMAQMTNGDSNLDVVTSSFGTTDSGQTTIFGNSIDIFQGDGTGAVNNIATLTDGISFIPTALALADFDGDGKMDIAATIPGVPPDEISPQPDGTIQIMTGNGAGGFTFGNTFDSGGALPLTIAVADLNGDNKPDLVIANAGDPDASNFYQNFGSNSSIGLALNTGGGNFNSLSPLTAGLGTSKSVFAVTAADFDLDGKMDVAGIAYGNPLTSANARILEFKGDGSGGFSADANSPYNTSATDGQFLAAAPIDANSSPDIVYCTDNGHYGVLLNNTVVAPAVTINQSASQADPTNGTSIDFSVVFSTGVTGFSSAGVSLSGSTGDGAGLTPVVTQIDSSHYTVTVTGMSPGTTGQVKATITAGAATALSNGVANAASTSTDNSVTYDYVAPTVTINQAAGQADPTLTGPILFTVVFSKPVTGFATGDIDLGGSSLSGLSAVVTQNTTSNYTVTVTGMSGNGTVVATVGAGVASDLVGNPNSASTSTDNTVTFNTPASPPTVTINQSAGQPDPTATPSIKFDVVFSKPVVGFDGSKVNLGASTAVGNLIAAVTGSGPAYTVTVTGMTAGGSVIASISAGVVDDGSGNLNQASTSTDNTITYVASGVVQFSAPTYSINQNGSPTLTVHVTRTGGTEGPLSVNYATGGGTAVPGTDYTDCFRDVELGGQRHCRQDVQRSHHRQRCNERLANDRPGAQQYLVIRRSGSAIDRDGYGQRYPDRGIVVQRRQLCGQRHGWDGHPLRASACRYHRARFGPVHGQRWHRRLERVPSEVHPDCRHAELGRR